MRRQAQASAVESNMRRRLAFGSSALCIVAILLAGFASSALGAQGHPYTGVSFGPDGVGGTESFENVGSVAVDSANGDVYVYDVGAGKIYKFDSAGAPVDFLSTGDNAIPNVGVGRSIALNEIALAPAGSPAGTAGDIYVANFDNGNAIHVYSPAGVELEVIDQGEATCGVAIDPAGNFYAGVYPSTINKFTPTTNPPTAADKSGTGSVPRSICNVAADGLGNVYAADFSGGQGLYKLEGIADATPTRVDPSANTMGIAPGSNDLYANRGNVVVQYDSAGNELGNFGDGELSESRGVAINSGATKVYVGAGQKVKMFGTATTLPDARTEAAETTKHEATLHGTIGAAGGPAATCAFQYTTSQEFFSQGFAGAPEVPCSPAGPFTGSSSTPVSAAITGLDQEAQYFFRLVGSSENGSLPGKSLSFATAGAVNVTTGAATLVTASSATLNGTVNPEGTELDECFFEYGKTSALGNRAPCAETPAAIGNGNSPISVHADLTGIESATEYRFRLGGKNELGTDVGQFAEFKTPGAGIERESVAGVTPNSAIFKAQINPNGEATTYSFEYVSEADFKTSGFANAIQLPSGGETIGSGAVGVEVEQEAIGLTPRTTYHLRVTAPNASGDATGPEIVFSTFPTDGSGGLPDGRVYEQASPVKKDGNNIQGSVRSIKTSPSGEGITFVVFGGLPDAEGGQDFGSFLARRGESGWTTQGLLPSAKLGTKGYAIGLSEDLSVVYTESKSRYPLQRAFGEKNTYSNQYTQILGKSGFNWPGGEPEYKAGSANNDLALFAAGPLTPEGAEGVSNLYIWDRANQRLVLAGVFNDGQAPVEGSIAGWGGEFSCCSFTQEQHVLSADGSKVFFTDNGTHQLYMRINPTQPQSEMNGEECIDAAKACTYQVSKSQRSTPDPMGPQAAKFVTATADGSKVLFMSSEELTDDANTGPEDNSNDLYSYDTNTHELTDLTASTLAENPNGGEVSGVLGISKDASYIYFGAGGVFAPGASAGEHCVDGGERSGRCNIYRWHEGDVTRVTQLEQFSEAVSWLSDLWAPFENFRHPHTARVSTDGKTLLMLVPKNLTGYDSHGFQELYRFHVGDSKPLCVSCMPSGEEPRGNTTLQGIEASQGILPSHQNTFNSRNMAASGNRIFFESDDKLVGADTNGVKDVYEWEAEGTGSCTSSDQDGGCLYLISTGTSPEPSYFADAGESGDDAYFFTNQPLVGQDRDELVDVYDARVGGGLASQNPPPPSICTGEACRPGATPAPAGQTAGTSTFSGPGNPSAKKSHHKKKHKSKSKKKSKKHQKKGAKSRQGGN